MERWDYAVVGIIALAFLVAFDCPSPPILLASFKAFVWETMDRLDSMSQTDYVLLLGALLLLVVAGNVVMNRLSRKRR